jgi:transcriptional regulator with XRE-family HTH domain
MAAEPVSDLMRTVGARIRALREIYDVTQEEIAKEAGLNRTSITNIESGRQNAQLDALAAVAKHFGVSLGALLGESDLPALSRVLVVSVCEVRCETCGVVAQDLPHAQAYEVRKQHIRGHLGAAVAKMMGGADG